MIDTLFQFFLPADFQGPTVSKLWGAVNHYVRVNLLVLIYAGELHAKSIQNKQEIPKSRRDHDDTVDLRDFIDMVDSIAKKIRPISDILSKTSPQEQALISVPRELVTTWMHLLVCATSLPNSDSFDENRTALEKLVESGIRSLVQSGWVLCFNQLHCR